MTCAKTQSASDEVTCGVARTIRVRHISCPSVPLLLFYESNGTEKNKA
jgi:hypothetical protein